MASAKFREHGENFTVKHMGLIGGLSPESTIHYYQIICREHNRRCGGLNFPRLTIESLNLAELVPLFEINDWEGVATILLAALHRLKNAGAEFAAILANTPHNAYDRIQAATPLKIVTIMEATAAALKRAAHKNVALLGSKATMEFDFFQKYFATEAIQTIVPDATQRQELDGIIWNELAHGQIRPESRQAARRMLATLQEHGAEAVVLGCTELSLLIQSKDTQLPLFDTAKIHAEAILEFASSSGEPQTLQPPGSTPPAHEFTATIS